MTAGCTAELNDGEYGSTEIILDCGEEACRSSISSEDGIWDVNLYVFAENGMEEFHRYIEYGNALHISTEISVRLVKSREYTIVAFANAGFDTGDFQDWQTMKKWKYYLAYPDGGNRGIPMCGVCEGFLHDGNAKVTVQLERLMSRISIRLDKSRLDKDIDFHIMRATIGNCPKCMTPFSESPRENADYFAYGYSCEWFSDKWDSAPVNVYMLENKQGHLDRNRCSYVELEIDYNSPECHSSDSRGLVYRFYIRENDSYNVLRNSIYNITVCPRANGLMCDDDWRVDKSSLIYEKDTSARLEIIPEGTDIDGRFYAHFFRMAKGESRHFVISKNPENMDIHFREDLLQDEKNEGRAEYIMDDNQKGFTVKSLGKTCSTAMEIHAGDPLNSSIMLVIEIE